MNKLSIDTSDMIDYLSDEDIVTKYINTKEEQYWNALYKRYQSKVFATCIDILKDDQITYDVLQDIFIKVFRSIDTFNNKSKFSTWLYSITFNQCIDILRQEKKYQIQRINPNQEFAFLDPEWCDAVLLEVKITILDDILQSLSWDDRNIIYLKYRDNNSIKRIAEILNIRVL